MKYCKQSTEEHPLCKMFPSYLESINTIINNEGGTHQPFNDEVALNLDKIKSNSGNTHIKKMKSMDMVICVIDNDDKVHSLLIDYKLNCNGTKSLSDGDCRDKIKHSTIILFGSGIPIYNKYVFIFKDELLEQSRSIISRVLNNATIEVLNINEFRTNYFD
ncbi:MAG: hypothetical protein WC139_05465 [Candidatus Kapaibacterium sp.]